MKPRTVNKIATSLIVFFAMLIVAILLGLLGYILFRGLSHISWDFLFSAPQKIRAGGGIGPQLFNSLFLLVLTLIITVPLDWVPVFIWRNMLVPVRLPALFA